MCSISGIVNGDIISLKKMVSAQSHRAPDDSGFYNDNKIFIGMGRLKIIDLKSDNLCPYIDEDLVLSYNGEIYNYIELKEYLKKQGYNFSTSSDTEVLIKMYDNLGEKAFDKLEGMWSIALFDLKKN